MRKNFNKLILIIVLIFASFGLHAEETKRDTVLTSTIEFYVNTDKVIKNENYENFINCFIPIIKNNENRVNKVLIIGCASIEGRAERNEYLANIRAKKGKTLIEDFVENDKIYLINNKELFLNVTGRDKLDYNGTRSAYFEAWVSCHSELNDTVYIKTEKRDTIYQRDTITNVFYLEKPFKKVPYFAIKSNIITDIVLAPNIQAELYTNFNGVSLEFEYTFPWWKSDKAYIYYQVLNGSFGVRKYLKDTYDGHYFGLYGNTLIYDICINEEKGWQGEGWGAGLSYGYVFRNKRHPKWKFEPYIRIGYMYTKFDAYHASDPWDGKYYYDWYKKASDFVPRRMEINYFGPTMIGFNLTYDLIWLRKY